MSKTPRINKWVKIKVIQFFYPGAGYGWEDVSEYWPDEPNHVKEARKDLREYRFGSRPGEGSYRLITRTVLNPAHPDYQEPAQ